MSTTVSMVPASTIQSTGSVPQRLRQIPAQDSSQQATPSPAPGSTAGSEREPSQTDKVNSQLQQQLSNAQARNVAQQQRTVSTPASPPQPATAEPTQYQINPATRQQAQQTAQETEQQAVQKIAQESQQAQQSRAPNPPPLTALQQYQINQTLLPSSGSQTHSVNTQV